MRSLLCIVSVILLRLLASGQPLTPSELAWGNTASVYGGDSFYLIKTNTILTNTLIGGGSRPFVFSASQPAHGVVANLNTALGTNTYTPATDFIGYDGFDYNVTILGQSKRAPGHVDVAVVDAVQTNSCTSWIVTNRFFSIVSGGVTNGGTVCFPPDSPCPAGDAFSLNFPLNTNLSWSLSFSDSLGLYAPTSWQYNAGDPLTTWTPSVSVVRGTPLFCVPPIGGGNCINAYGDISTWTLCPVRGCNSNPTNEMWAYVENGGTYTSFGVVTNQNYFEITGYNPPSTVGCTIPTSTTVSFSICNDALTNRDLILYGYWNWFSQGTVSAPGFAGNLDVNGSHFSLFNTGGTPHSDLSDCSVGSTAGSGSALVASNLVTVAAGTTTNLTVSLRFYMVSAATPKANQLSLTNFWK